MPTINLDAEVSELATDPEVVETLEHCGMTWLTLISSAVEEQLRKVPQVTLLITAQHAKTDLSITGLCLMLFSDCPEGWGCHLLTNIKQNKYSRELGIFWVMEYKTIHFHVVSSNPVGCQLWKVVSY